jgi:hypothetical protein
LEKLYCYNNKSIRVGLSKCINDIAFLITIEKIIDNDDIDGLKILMLDSVNPLISETIGYYGLFRCITENKTKLINELNQQFYTTDSAINCIDIYKNGIIPQIFNDYFYECYNLAIIPFLLIIGGHINLVLEMGRKLDKFEKYGNYSILKALSDGLSYSNMSDNICIKLYAHFLELLNCSDIDCLYYPYLRESFEAAGRYSEIIGSKFDQLTNIKNQSK